MPLSEEEQKKLDEQFKSIQTTIETLATSQSKFQENFDTVSDTLLGINEKLGAGPKSKDPEPGPSARDLETLNRGEFMDTILEKVGTIVKQEITPVAERVESESTTRQQRDVAGQIKDAETKHKDFWDWKDEMGRIAKAHQTLPVEDIYLMARGKDSIKTKELDEKYEPKKEPEEEPEAFGGLFPSSGNLSTEELKKNMTSDEAADLAWEKTMSGVQLLSE